MRAPSVVIYGCGEMGLLIASMLLERGADIRGAIVRSPRQIGQDLGSMAGVGPIGVVADAEAHAVLERSRADVVVVTTGSPLGMIEPHIRAAMEAGSNVVTLEEQSFYPWLVAPALAQRLDMDAKANGVTILGTGLQDIRWTALPASLMSGTQGIRRVRGRSTYNTDDFGPASGSGSADQQWIVGRPPEALDTLIGDGAWEAPTVLTVAQALAVLNNLTPSDHRVEIRPVIAAEPRRSARHGFTVDAGTLLGYSESVELNTSEGPVIEFELSGYLHASGEQSVNDWAVEGDAFLESVDHRFDARAATASAVVTRIPDVIASDPGFATVAILPRPCYRNGPLLIP